ncbi:MAG: bifunctional [glutamate--ammonia ligase]-adenylyl-L-tyrosine phosphorylase/[glutamate--ammonia-ligase] adenylyltransferase [Sulfurifustis sp.]
MLDSAQRLFDAALVRMPIPLRPAAEAHWRNFRDQLPRLPQTGAERWLTALPTAFTASDFAARTCAQHPAVLSDLIESGDLFRAYEEGELARRIARELAGVADESALKLRLRALRRREMLRVALRVLALSAPLSEVLAALSEFADACLEGALGHLESWAAARYGMAAGRNGDSLRLVVLALGKLGGRELNFSSDVDLMFAYPEDGETSGPKKISHQEFYVRLGQALINTLSESTADGFVFRVDMRLRPNGASGPLALSFDAMEHYYQTHGREWERYAFIKARVCAGDREAGASLLARLRPFVYRRYIDFGALAAIREMKELIAREVERKSMADNVKLGPGGIREIEFIAQAQQLIRGGREPVLQERATVKVLHLLTGGGYLDAPVTEELVAAYEFLRRSEHRLQMVSDQQTHTLPSSDTERVRLAFSMGFADWAAYAAALERHRRRVQTHFIELLGPVEESTESTDAFTALWSGALDEERGAAILENAGYGDAAAVLSLLKQLRDSSGYQALSAEGRVRIDRLVPLLLREAAGVRDPDTTITRLVHLCESIGRRTAYFALLIENPTARTQLVNLAAASPWIAGWISLHPVVLDELLDPRGLYELPDRAQLDEELRAKLRALAPEDLEAQMDSMREFRHAHMLRIAAADIGPGLAADQVGAHLAQLADVVLSNALDLSSRTLVERHGTPGGDERYPVPGFAVIGYGKLGSVELGYASDLDMIFLYEDVDGAMTAGPRSIPNELFFARLGQRLINLLTTRTPAGILYQVDMRLRPSGNAGPLVTSLTAFKNYQQNRAWTWEHQALVRARPVAGPERLCGAFEEVRRAVLAQPRDDAQLRREVREMRGRMAAVHPSAGDDFDVKHDRGGIVDIEFMVQYWVLAHAHRHPDVTAPRDNIHIMEALARRRLISAERAEVLTDAYRRCLSVEQRLKLMERGARVPGAELGSAPESVLAIWRDVIERE